MPAESALKLYFGAAVALLFIGALVLPLSRSGWQRRSQPGLMVFRRPLGPRILLILAGLWLIAVWPLAGATGRNGWVKMSPVIPPACLLGGSLILLASRRYDLRLDLERQTYRLTSGWLLRSRVRSGSLLDFAGVYVRIVRTSGGETSSVGLDWRNEGPARPRLGIFNSGAKAEAFASKMSTALNLPIIPAPEPEALRSLFS